MLLPLGCVQHMLLVMVSMMPAKVSYREVTNRLLAMSYAQCTMLCSAPW